MTITNRAFIKAYRADEAQAGPAAPSIDLSGRAPSAHTNARRERVANTSEASPAAAGERSALYGPLPVRNTAAREPDPSTLTRGIDTPATGRSDAFRKKEVAPAHEAIARSVDSAQTTRPRQQSAPVGEKRPLSSFIASTGIARLDNELAEGDFFRPGNTVTSFHWPEVCRVLSRHCGQKFGAVADLLITHANTGRSLVGVLGLTSGAGASTVAMCLAARLAERGRRVILVDGNFRRPRLAKSLEVELTAGWQDVLKHGAPLTDAVVRATEDHVDLLALGEKIPNDPVKLVAGLQAVVTAGVLRHAYDHVLIDAGAVLDSASQPIAFELIRNMGVDAAITVSGPSTTDQSDISILAEHLHRTGCEYLGTIVNRDRVRS
jgi:Mrp family chromosome partitioning ATPase